jgi:ethanolamine permease
VAVGAYLVFMALNILGVSIAATFELLVTLLAIFELLVFMGVVAPGFEMSNFVHGGWAGSDTFSPAAFSGIFAAIPFAIWFFLAIEGVANVAEETINPQRNILRGFGSALATLIVLCILTFLGAVGVGGWEKIVYPSPGAPASDSPLPLALAQITGDSGWLYHLLITIGLMGLVASFHGIILAAGRATFEFGRVNYIPSLFGKVHLKFKTPANALLINMLVGIIALLTGKTSEIITIACFGALTLYVLSMITVIALRRKEPTMIRPFRVPFYPYFPVIALVIAFVALIAMTTLNIKLALIYFGILGLSYIWFHLAVKKTLHGTSDNH